MTRLFSLALCALIVFAIGGLNACGGRDKESCPPGTTQQEKMEKGFRLVGCMDSEGKAQGKGTGWHENGQKIYDGRFRDDMPHGKWTVWEPNGKKTGVLYFRDGKKHGKETLFHDNGKTLREGENRDGVKDGEWTVWYENGKKER